MPLVMSEDEVLACASPDFSCQALSATPTMMSAMAPKPRMSCQVCGHSLKANAPMMAVKASCRPLESGMARETPR